MKETEKNVRKREMRHGGTFAVGLLIRVFWLRLGVISAPPPDTANGFKSAVDSAVVI